jgi:alpha-tubulin suppressor-like RCC1 family protein
VFSKNDIRVVDIASGAGHCLALDEDGFVYSWGASADFQTGHFVPPAKEEGDTRQFITQPKVIEALSQKGPIIAISCGIKHSAVVTKRCELICFGSNEFGQCGDGKHTSMKQTFDINIALKGRQIGSIACGGAHTIVKLQSQELYSFGLNDKGQLGLGIANKQVTVPAKIKNFTSFGITKLICAGKFQTVLSLI